jgi:hypothetical protein
MKWESTRAQNQRNYYRWVLRLSQPGRIENTKTALRMEMIKCQHNLRLLYGLPASEGKQRSASTGQALGELTYPWHLETYALKCFHH